MKSAASQELRRRIDDRISGWRIAVEHVTETESSILVFGRRDGQPVVLKVIRNRGDEWRSGEILDAFGGKGVVRVYEYVDGAILLERLHPGQSLAGQPQSWAALLTQSRALDTRLLPQLLWARREMLPYLPSLVPYRLTAAVAHAIDAIAADPRAYTCKRVASTMNGSV